MNEDDIETWDDEPDNANYELKAGNITTRASMLASRRRIEDLKELRRMRELLGDDDFDLDFN